MGPNFSCVVTVDLQIIKALETVIEALCCIVVLVFLRILAGASHVLLH